MCRARCHVSAVPHTCFSRALTEAIPLLNPYPSPCDFPLCFPPPVSHSLLSRRRSCFYFPSRLCYSLFPTASCSSLSLRSASPAAQPAASPALLPPAAGRLPRGRARRPGRRRRHPRDRLPYNMAAPTGRPQPRGRGSVRLSKSPGARRGRPARGSCSRFRGNAGGWWAGGAQLGARGSGTRPGRSPERPNIGALRGHLGERRAERRPRGFAAGRMLPVPGARLVQLRTWVSRSSERVSLRRL